MKIYKISGHSLKSYKYTSCVMRVAGCVKNIKHDIPNELRDNELTNETHHASRTTHDEGHPIL